MSSSNPNIPIFDTEKQAEAWTRIFGNKSKSKKNIKDKKPAKKETKKDK